MIWNDVLDVLEGAGLKPVEETYMEHYGKVLAAQRPEFQDRHFRCTYGVLSVEGVRFEVFMFPSELQLGEFLEVVGPDPSWIVHGNLVVHVPDYENVSQRVITALLSADAKD